MDTNRLAQFAEKDVGSPARQQPTGGTSTLPDPSDQQAAEPQHKGHGLLCALPALWQTLRPRRGELSTIGSPVFDQDDVARLHFEVEKLYGRVATDPQGKFHFHRGADYAASMLGYDRAELDALPQAATQSFAGVGNPHLIDPLRAGEVVLDIGCGSGTDLLLAARRVGPSGRAIGLDLTANMVERCRTSIAEAGMTNVEVMRGDGADLPLADVTVDAVISNGALNLVPNKDHAFREIYRVLRPGGRLMMGDTALSRGLAWFMRRNVDLWALCVGGALSEAEWIAVATTAGFEPVGVTHRFDCVKGTQLDFIARWLGISGMNLQAAKPVSA